MLSSIDRSIDGAVCLSVCLFVHSAFGCSHCHVLSVRSLMVRIEACHALDPSLILGRRIFCICGWQHLLHFLHASQHQLKCQSAGRSATCCLCPVLLLCHVHVHNNWNITCRLLAPSLQNKHATRTGNDNADRDRQSQSLECPPLHHIALFSDAQHTTAAATFH